MQRDAIPEHWRSICTLDRRVTSNTFDPVRLRQVHAVMAGYIERAEIPGLVTLVSRNDEVHVEALGTLTTNAGAPMQRDTIFRIASLTKPIGGSSGDVAPRGMPTSSR